MKILSSRNFIIFSLILIITPIIHIKLDTGDDIQSYFGQNIEPAELDSYLAKKMQQKPIPGLAVGIINRGQLTHEFYKGYANKELKIAINKDTLFEAASTSKSVFGSLVMKYVENENFELDRSLHDYYPVKYADDLRFRLINARIALSHQTGWPNWRWDYQPQTLEFHQEPKQGFLYSGEGYQYLAETLRHTSGGEWSDLEQKFQDWIAKPLHMSQSTFIEPTPVSGLKAHPYDKQGNPINYQELADYHRNKGVFVAAASLITNVQDFSKWIISLTNESLLSNKSKNIMFAGQVSTEQAPYPDVKYTLGFYKIAVPGVELYAHGGNNHGFTSWFVVDPEKQWGMVLLSNSEYGEMLGTELLGYLLTGPNLFPYLLILIGLLLLLLTMVYYVIKFAIKRIRKD